MSAWKDSLVVGPCPLTRVFSTTNADSEEGVAFEHVERAGDRTAHPVGFLAEPVDDARLAQLLLAFRPRLLRGFAGSGLFCKARRSITLRTEDAS